MSFANYTAANITGLVSAVHYANYVTDGIFAPMILLMTFVIFSAVFFQATKERAFAVSLFICLFPNMLMVAAGVLNPLWLLVNFIAFAAAALLLGRLSQ